MIPCDVGLSQWRFPHAVVPNVHANPHVPLAKLRRLAHTVAVESRHCGYAARIRSAQTGGNSTEGSQRGGAWPRTRHHMTMS